MKILNLYAGIGGNRKFWGDDYEITAIEHDPKIAKIYQDLFPNDTVIIADAHQYLVDHFEEYDFIWSSPPCPSHSRVRKATRHQNKPIFPNMKLYEEILLLQGYFNGHWVVENVESWYKPLIEPQRINKHYYWSNFEISPIEKHSRCHDGSIKELQERKGFDLSVYSGIDKRLVLRNCVEPESGKSIFNDFLKIYENKNKNSLR